MIPPRQLLVVLRGFSQLHRNNVSRHIENDSKIFKDDAVGSVGAKNVNDIYF
jgi:hypothetical protein